MQNKRVEENANGDFYALELEFNCGCGQPEAAAPDLVKMSDKRGLQSFFYKQPTTEVEVQRAIDAVNVCPIHELRYGGKDPGIIARVDPDLSDYRVVDGQVIPVE